MENQKSQSEKIRIHADPVLKELIPGYLENRRKDLLVYRQALGKDDYESIYTLGHSMKGSGGGYGFNDLSSIGGAIEKAAKNKDKESVHQSIIDLADFLKNLEVIYD